MMDAALRQFCPLCRGEMAAADAVREHLIADHRRSSVEADELIARFDIAKAIPEPERFMCWAPWAGTSGPGRAVP
jgi:hypothetical protein